MRNEYIRVMYFCRKNTFDNVQYVRNTLDGQPGIDMRPDIDKTEDLNYRPIIGILAQELSEELEPWYGDNYTSYIGAAYVKWIEQAGARVVPVLINQDEEYYETIFSSTNGLVFPGGQVSLDESGIC